MVGVLEVIFLPPIVGNRRRGLTEPSTRRSRLLRRVVTLVPRRRAKMKFVKGSDALLCGSELHDVDLEPVKYGNCVVENPGRLPHKLFVNSCLRTPRFVCKFVNDPNVCQYFLTLSDENGSLPVSIVPIAVTHPLDLNRVMEHICRIFSTHNTDSTDPLRNKLEHNILLLRAVAG